MRLRTLLLASGVLLLAVACDKKKEEPTPKPQPATPEIKVPTESQAIFSSGMNMTAGTSAQSQTVSFTATEAWSADVADTKASSWLSVQPSSGSAGTVNMTVTAQPNTGEAARSAKVTLKCGTVTKTFSVTQEGVPPATVEVESVSLNKAELTLEPGKSETLTATVKPDNATDKTITWSTSNAEVATVDNGRVTAVKDGEAIISAKAGDKEATCKVTVATPEEVPFAVTPTSVEVAAEGGTFEVTVTCSTTYHLNSKPDWVTEKSVNGKVHTFEVAANTATEDRSGVVVFCDDKGTCLPCNVKQKGKEEDVPFSVSPTSVEMAAEGGTFEVTVTCSTTYHLNSKPEWVTEKSVNGKVHTFEVAANTTTEDRSGVVVFCDDKGTCLPCNVKQKGAATDNSTDGNTEDVTNGDPVKW